MGHAAMGAVAASQTGLEFRWADVAAIMSFLGSYVLFGVVTVIAVWRLIKSRSTIGVAVTGCVP